MASCAPVLTVPAVASRVGLLPVQQVALPHPLCGHFIGCQISFCGEQISAATSAVALCWSFCSRSVWISCCRLSLLTAAYTVASIAAVFGASFFRPVYFPHVRWLKECSMQGCSRLKPWCFSACNALFFPFSGVASCIWTKSTKRNLPKRANGEGCAIV